MRGTSIIAQIFMSLTYMANVVHIYKEISEPSLEKPTIQNLLSKHY